MMAIRYLAVELYRWEKEVDRLIKALEEVPFEKKAEIEIKLKQAIAQRDEWRAKLEAKKEPPTYRKIF
jgi:hypothetical protein